MKTVPDLSAAKSASNYIAPKQKIQRPFYIHLYKSEKGFHAIVLLRHAKYCLHILKY